MQRDLAAEFIGTFSLVSAVCGAALFSAPQAGLMPIAFAVGLSVMAMAFAVGHISGAHFNPAVTCGLVAAGRFPADRAPAYIVMQVVGGAAAAGVFYVVLDGAPPIKWNTFTTISNLYGSGGVTFSLPGSIRIRRLDGSVRRRAHARSPGGPCGPTGATL